LGLSIGDPDALAVKELMERSIQDMLASLAGQQPMHPPLEGTAEAVFHTLRRLRESAPVVEASFHAIPRAVECFDGESAYVIREQGEVGRFIWQDFVTKQVRELIVNFIEYCSDWGSVCLSLAGGGHDIPGIP
jgi:hypothetical protein